MDQQLIEHENRVTSKEHLLPVAEVFTSIHGEGTWSGTRMTFVRLAGCSVGKPSTSAQFYPNLPIYHPNGAPAYICKAWNGTTFTCDTIFHLDRWWGMDDIVARIKSDGTKHVCLTGGEPLMHLNRLRFVGFFTKLAEMGILVHIETSGTIEFPINMHTHAVWITVSPKWEVLPVMINIANEVRLLIGPDFQSFTLPQGVRTHDNVFISPINDINELDKNSDTMTKCMDLLKAHPQWRLSIQMHKVYGLR